MRPIKKNSSLAMHIIAQIAGLVFFICSSITAIVFFSYKKSNERQLASTMAKRCVDAGKLVDKELTGYIKQVEDIAQREEIRNMNWEIQKTVLISEAKRIGFERFQVGDLNGNVISTTGDTAQAGDRTFYKQALSGISNISDVLYGRIDRKMVIVVSSPIYDNSGSVTGVLSGVTAADKLNQITANIDLDYDGGCFVINKSGAKMAGIDYTTADKLDNDLEKKK